jgi:WD40 repeat protein
MTARLWDATTGEPLTPPLRHSGEVIAVAISPGGRTGLTASVAATARLWDPGTAGGSARPCRAPLPSRRASSAGTARGCSAPAGLIDRRIPEVNSGLDAL